jgi:tRNA threonylcarbamoyladenosine biosynthesis protein TsaB
MARILSLETSTDVCSVALFDNGVLVKEIVLQQAQAHASRLAPIIQDIFKEASFRITDLNSIAITSGPGSYTGLRIGTSTAKGICYALDIPLIAIPTLSLLAYQASQRIKETAILCPMIDARRMEVYCQCFDSDLKEITPVEAKVIDGTGFQELLSVQKMFLFGNGAEKCKDTLKNPNAKFLDNIFPQASALCELASRKFETGKFEDLENFKPFYLKDFVAKKAQPLFD